MNAGELIDQLGKLPRTTRVQYEASDGRITDAEFVVVEEAGPSYPPFVVISEGRAPVEGTTDARGVTSFSAVEQADVKMFMTSNGLQMFADGQWVGPRLRGFITFIAPNWVGRFWSTFDATQR